MKSSTSIIKIAPALLAAQKNIGAAKKDSANPFFHSKYADLGSVMEACKDALNEQEIVALQPVMGTFVETVLLHASGEWISSETAIVSKDPSNPQSVGSAISYARRYGLQSLVFIPAEDDDGNTASGAKKKADKAFDTFMAPKPPTTQNKASQVAAAQGGHVYKPCKRCGKAVSAKEEDASMKVFDQVLHTSCEPF